MTLFRSLRHRSFALLWTGQTISRLGDSLYRIALAGVANFTVSGPFSVALPFLVKINLHASVGGLGLLISAGSVGSVIGAVWLGRSTRIRHRGLIAYLSWVVGGLMLVTYGLPLLPGMPSDRALLLIALASVAFGAAFSTLILIWANTLQELDLRHLLGRVSSIDQLGSFALIPFGLGVAGWATDLVGAPLVFLIGGVTTATLGALGLAIPEIRNLD
jgi:MFS family permease